jgi:hypothetical protein
MATELALIPGTPTERWQYAEKMAKANLLPASFRGRQADVFYAVEYGAMLGLSPIAALTGIHVIEGKPTASAALMSGLVRQHGHRLRVRLEGTIPSGDLRAITELVRADDPEHTFVAQWDLSRASRAGLLTLKQDRSGAYSVEARSKDGKPGSWEKYTENMLKARAISEVVRDGAEDCIFGMHYTPEELGAEVDADGDVVPVVATAETLQPEPARTPGRGPRPAAATAREDIVDAEVVADQPNIALAVGVATLATECGDAEELLRIYAEAKARGLLTAPVDDEVTADQAAAAGVTGPITLDVWLKACGKYARSNGGMSIQDAVNADAPIPATA